jgi:hypothetical protein
MQMESRMRVEPGLDVGVLVGGVVVQDHVDGKAFGHFTVDGAQELEELLVTVHRYPPRGRLLLGEDSQHVVAFRDTGHA